MQETVRTAVCPIHNRASRDYVGVNTKGLIFRCEGEGKGSGTWHYFTTHGMPEVAS